MAWTKAEKELVDERFNRVYDAVEANAKLNEEHHKAQMGILEELKIQTTKTNGRVTTLEGNQKDHIVNCPVAPKVNALQKRANRYYLLEKYPAVFIVGGVVFGLIGVFTFLANIGVIGP